MVLEAQGTFSPCSFCEQSALQAFQGQRTRSLQTVRREGVRLPAGPGSLQSGKGARLGRARRSTRSAKGSPSTSRGAASGHCAGPCARPAAGWSAP